MFEGTIPTQISQLSALESLLISENFFTGTLPSELAQLDLKFLQAQDNHFNGTVPIEIFGVEELQVLHLGQNMFSGELHPDLGNLINLVDLRLEKNQFQGDLPFTFFLLNKLRKSQCCFLF